jgi:molecular chaperone GrpE (heat shock protein)
MNKQHLLSTARQYLLLLDEDAEHFHATIDTTLQEKVQNRKQEVEAKSRRIQQLSQELADLQQEIAAMDKEAKENEEKIKSSAGSYKAEMENVKNNILQDIEKIKNYIN